MARKLTKLTVKWLENPELRDERYDVTVPNLRGLDPIEERENRLRAAEGLRREQTEASTVEYVVEQFFRTDSA